MAFKSICKFKNGKINNNNIDRSLSILTKEQGMHGMVDQVCLLLLCLQKLCVLQEFTCTFPMITEFAALNCIVQDTVPCMCTVYAYLYKPASLTVSQTMTSVS